MTSKSFVYECAPHVIFKGHWEDGRGDDSCGEVLLSFIKDVVVEVY